MNLTIIKSVRTNNFEDEAIMQKITEMWKEASSALLNQDEVTYGLYHEYESDYKGDYTVSVAVESSNNVNTIKIPNISKYEIFKVDSLDENGILNTWKQIWEREEKGDLKRAYSFDFEKYNPNGQIEIHIATK
ncbi:effector binding domain-containing protein [Alkalihalophilus lindianensis]|uniref:Effector binding domain-containing protein n=1 Tax=Alkalihalophilus lindianensis TaxID=1630542 RepID=A0ABU3XGA1_9BACI|nr:effector binding domain-containing protein [Alkalihalophilus lindianensis]MDV2686414.1 effector binding domain-containing protein [Alkalihalophilus lindianensis]